MKIVDLKNRKVSVNCDPSAFEFNKEEKHPDKKFEPVSCYWCDSINVYIQRLTIFRKSMDALRKFLLLSQCLPIVIKLSISIVKIPE